MTDPSGADLLASQLEDLREQQRAISGVLHAVVRSAGLQPVLDEIVEASKLDQRDHELQAVRLALAAQMQFDELASAWRKRGIDLGGAGAGARHAGGAPAKPAPS